MKQQRLLLEPTASSWRLDAETCEIGRRGVAAARQALARARGSRSCDSPDEHSLAA